MGLINKERFVDLMVASAPIPVRFNPFEYVAPAANNLANQVGAAIPGVRDVLGGAVADRASALVCFEMIKDYIKRNGYLAGKQLRPWDIDANLYAGLDRAKPWWGFEFETGYKSRDMRAEVIDHVWETWDNVVFDSEGEGNAAVEITFTPAHMEDYLNGTADACQFIRYLDGNPRVMKTNEVSIGTHINISHPLLNVTNLSDVVYSMNRTLAALPVALDGVPDVRLKMFGRSHLYGGFFTNAVRDSVWTEGKLFRTTYDYETFQTYIKVSEALTKVLEVLCKTPRKNGRVDMDFIPYVDNLYEVAFEGAEPVIAWSRNLGELDGLRRGNAINGMHARKKPGDPDVAPFNVYDEDDDDYADDDDDYYDYDDEQCQCDECREARGED